MATIGTFNIQLSTEGEAQFTDSEGDSFFSFYQIS